MIAKNPRVSIITVSLNSQETICDTIESVLSQVYDNIEYIIIDGLSSDNTIAVAKRYEPKFIVRGYSYKIISEVDKGLYDAMNKGIKLASGDIIGILNSDDIYCDEHVIMKIVERITSENVDCLYANLRYVDKYDTSKVIREWQAKKGDFRLGWNPPHPTTFITKETYNRFGLYKTGYTISSDYDLLYRIIYKAKLKVTYLDEYIVSMRSGGKSTNGIRANITASIEIYDILKKNGQRYKLLIIMLRLIRKIKQLFI